MQIKEMAMKIKNMPQEEFRFWMLFLVPAGLILSGMMIPQDDYWRHLAAAVKDLSYRSFYFDTRLPNFNQYIGYDILLSYLYRIFGEYSYVPLQMLSLIFFTAGFYIATRNLPPNIRTVFYTILLLSVFGRILLARPVILESAVFFFLWFYESRKVRLFLSSILAPLYWLFFLYLIPLMLKEKYVILPLIAGFIFWHAYSNGEYFREVLYVFDVASNRTVAILEGVGIYMAILNVSILSILPIIMLAKEEKMSLKEIFNLDRKTFIASGFFFLSGQIRYFVDSIAPLLISLGRFVKKDVPEYVSAFALFVLVIFIPKPTQTFKDLESFKHVFENKKVLMLGLGHINFEATYRLLDVNARIVPAMEFEWANKDVKQLIKTANEKGSLNCSLLYKTSAEIVVENVLTGKPSCMEFLYAYKNYRIWKVK